MKSTRMAKTAAVILVATPFLGVVPAGVAGGLAIIAVVVLAITPPSIANTALIGAVPLALAALAIAFFGPETR